MMKLWFWAAIFAIFAAVSASGQQESPRTLEKRAKKVFNARPTTSTSSETPKPWIRTIYSTQVEIVTPTVIAGVTFRAKPAEPTKGVVPWVSLKKDGSPQTIMPKLKNGITEKASPTYSTYFQTATTVTYDYEQLKAHNMDPDSVHEEVEYIDEDKTYVSLNPLIRCTPDRYYMKGLARDVSSEPFCTPHENSKIKLDNTYFVTWYTRYFGDEAKKVRLHFSYVKQKLKDKGMSKREVVHAFYSTEWLDNVDGFYPLSIKEEWLRDQYEQNVAISIQPDNVPDEEFDLLEHATIVQFAKGSKVFKNTKEHREKLDQGIDHDGVYYAIVSIPAVVAVSILGMYFFLYLTRNSRDITDIRYKVWKSQHKVLGKFKSKKNRGYSELPKFNKSGNKSS